MDSARFRRPGPGRFIVLDGIDGCGKSTQARRLVEALEKATGECPLHLHEPGSTALGERLRSILLDRELAIGPASEALLFASARRQMLEERVRPALAAGRDVVCERFHPATYAYQGHAGALDERALLALLATWCDDPHPDRIVVIDVDPDEAACRRGAPRDRIEERGLEFQRRVAEGFRRYVADHDDTVLIDGRGSEEVVARRVLAEVDDGR